MTRFHIMMSSYNCMYPYNYHVKQFIISGPSALLKFILIPFYFIQRKNLSNFYYPFFLHVIEIHMHGVIAHIHLISVFSHHKMCVFLRICTKLHIQHFFIFIFVFLRQGLANSLNYPRETQTRDPPASTSPVVGSLVHITTSSLIDLIFNSRTPQYFFP